MKPLHKGGSRDVLTNYKPNFLLPVTSKVLEAVIRDQVISHLQDHNLLSPWQSGFRPGHSITTTLLYVTNEWYSALDRGLVVGAVFLDIAKQTFDAFYLTLLLPHLVDLRSDPATCEWFNSYLRERHQCTAIDGNSSDEAVVSSGVHQGSVLGPLHSTLFVNSLPSHIERVSTVMFADDTTLHVIGHSTTDISIKLLCALATAHRWLFESGLHNVAKTKCMLIHSCRRRSLPPLEVQLNGTHIQQVQKYKYLGVIISDTLSWSQHIDFDCSKAVEGIGLLC